MRNFENPIIFALLILVVNILIWLPVTMAYFPTIGLGHDSQIFTAAIHSELRAQNGLFELSPKLIAAREDIYSYPYFGILYPFYFTLGVEQHLTYKTNLILDFMSVVFHMMLASIAFAVLLRKMGCVSIVAILFGVFYGYSLHLKMWSSWVWALSGYAWIPLALLGVWEVVYGRRYRLGFIYMSLGFGFIALGSGLPLIYALVLAFGFGLFAVLKAKTTLSELAKLAICIPSAAMVSVAIGASHLLPVFDQSFDYVRWYSGGASIGSFKPPYEGTLATVLDFSLSGLMQFIVPTRWYGVGHPFLGLSVVAAAAIYLVANVRKLHIYPMLIIGIYFLLDAFGDATPVHRLTYQIPLLGSVRYPLANIYISNTVLLIFAAFGVSRLITSESHKKFITMILLGVASILGAGLLISQQQQLIGSLREMNVLVLMLPALAGLLLVILAKSKLSSVILLMVFASILPLNSMFYHPKIPTSQSFYLACDEFKRIESDLRSLRAGIDGPARFTASREIDFKNKESGCLSRLKLSYMHVNSIAMSSGWDVAQIYLSPRPYENFKLFNKLWNKYSSLEYSELLGAAVTHIMLPKKFKPSNAQSRSIEYVQMVGQYPLYRVKNYMLGQTAIGCLKGTSSENVNEFETVFGVRGLAHIPPNIANNSNYHCQIEKGSGVRIVHSERSGSTMTYHISPTNNDSIFISDQVYDDGWKVSIDGNSVSPFSIDGYRLGVQVPANSKSLLISYSPLSFKVGVTITYTGFFIVFFVFISIVFSARNTSF